MQGVTETKAILERLRRAEKLAKQRKPGMPGNTDGFLDALGVDAELFRRGDGYDAIAALSSTAKDDWK